MGKYTELQWRRVGQIFGGAGGNNEFESQARTRIKISKIANRKREAR